jgi:urocanate hydratase
MIKNAKKNKLTVSIAYLGNIVDVWERVAKEEDLLVELGSD